MTLGSDSPKPLSTAKKLRRLKDEIGAPSLSEIRPTMLTIWKTWLGPTPRPSSGGSTDEPVKTALSEFASPSNCPVTLGALVEGVGAPTSGDGSSTIIGVGGTAPGTCRRSSFQFRRASGSGVRNGFVVISRSAVDGEGDGRFETSTVD